MPAAGPQVFGFLLSATLVLLAIAFAYRQWLARRDRDMDLSAADHAYFSHQDVRRLVGSVTMLVMAVGMSLGLVIQPRASRADFRVWALLWIGVLVLACFLLILALVDWYAIRLYAGRHRRALVAERLEAIRAERQRLAQRPNGDASPEHAP